MYNSGEEVQEAYPLMPREGSGRVRVKFVIFLICTLPLSLVVAGCGSYTELAYREPLDTIEVYLTSEPTLEPSKVILDRPGTYAFKVENTTDSVAHALEIRAKEGTKINYKEEGSVRTADLAPGESNPEFNVVLEPGTYEVFCPVGHHRVQGEKGTFTVEEG